MSYNVFISWSGERSGTVAEYLKTWLPRVIQRVKPWMSKTDLYKGKRWVLDLAATLESIDVGILCVTRENKDAPWLLFEAGSLAKKGEARVFPYLLGMDHSELPEPLQQFNTVTADKDNTLKMLNSINDVVGGDKLLPEDRLLPEVCRASFEKWWPDLDTQLKAIPESSSQPPTPPTTEETAARLAAIVNAIPAIVSQTVAESLGRLIQSAKPDESLGRSQLIESSSGPGPTGLSSSTELPWRRTSWQTITPTTNPLLNAVLGRPSSGQ
jgi:hypothetical protein